MRRILSSLNPNLIQPTHHACEIEPVEVLGVQTQAEVGGQTATISGRLLNALTKTDFKLAGSNLSLSDAIAAKMQE